MMHFFNDFIILYQQDNDLLWEICVFYIFHALNNNNDNIEKIIFMHLIYTFFCGRLLHHLHITLRLSAMQLRLIYAINA
jgi:hypothetical protein